MDQTVTETQKILIQIREQVQAHLDGGTSPDALAFALVFVATEMSLQIAPNDLVVFQNAASAQLQAIEFIAELRDNEKMEPNSANPETNSEAALSDEKSSVGNVLH